MKIKQNILKALRKIWNKSSSSKRQN